MSEQTKVTITITVDGGNVNVGGVAAEPIKRPEAELLGELLRHSERLLAAQDGTDAGQLALCMADMRRMLAKAASDDLSGTM